MDEQVFEPINISVNEDINNIINVENIKTSFCDVDEIIVIIPERVKDLYPNIKVGSVVSAKKIFID